MRLSYLNNFRIPRVTRYTTMASVSNTKKHVRIDATIDTVCPWCLVGKVNLDKAVASSADKYDFEIKYHPYQLIPSAPKEGIVKRDFFINTYGARALQMQARMAEVFRGLGMNYDMAGLTGNTMESHRLIYFAGQREPDKQHKLVEELCIGYFTEGKYIGDRGFLIECAEKVGIKGAAEFLENPNNGLKEVTEEMKNASPYMSGVPHYVINGKHHLSGGQPPESFLKAFEVAASGK